MVATQQTKTAGGARMKSPITGTVVFWELSGGIRREDLEQIFTQKGAPDSWLPPIPTDKAAFTRTVKHLEKENILVKVREDDEVTAYAVASANVKPEDLDVDFTLRDVVIFNKKDGSIRLKLSSIDKAVVDELFEHFHYVHTVNDIRKMIVTALDAMGATMLRRRGGVYMVPPSKRDDLIMLKEIVGSIPGCYLYLMDLYDTEETKRSAITLIEKELISEVEDELKKLEDMAQRNVRTSTIAKTLEKYKEMILKAESYAYLLKEKSKEIEQKINQLQDKAKAILLEKI